MWFPQWLGGTESTCNAGDTGNASLSLGSGRSPGGRHGNPLQYTYLGNTMDREVWQGTVHGITKESDRNKVTEHTHKSFQKFRPMHVKCTIMASVGSIHMP